MSNVCFDGDVCVKPSDNTVETLHCRLELIDVMKMFDMVQPDDFTVSLCSKRVRDQKDPIGLSATMRATAHQELMVFFGATEKLRSVKVKMIRTAVQGIDWAGRDWRQVPTEDMGRHAYKILLDTVWLAKNEVENRMDTNGRLVITYKLDMLMSNDCFVRVNHDPDFVKREDVWKDLRKIVETSQLTDFTLRAKDSTEVHCHKLVLAANSKFFKGMFEVSEDVEDENELVFSDITGEALKAMVDYMYGRKVTLTSPSLTQELMVVFDKFDVGGSEGIVFRYSKRPNFVSV